MSEFVRACAGVDIPDGAAIRVVVNGVPLALAREGGEVFALYDECTHGRVKLSEGEVDGGTIECWQHGSTFDLRSGKPTCLPATEPVATYPVRIEGDDVLVAVGEN